VIRTRRYSNKCFFGSNNNLEVAVVHFRSQDHKCYSQSLLFMFLRGPKKSVRSQITGTRRNCKFTITYGEDWRQGRMGAGSRLILPTFTSDGCHISTTLC
jgi:hypothetical protein